MKGRHEKCRLFGCTRSVKIGSIDDQRHGFAVRIRRPYLVLLWLCVCVSVVVVVRNKWHQESHQCFLLSSSSLSAVQLPEVVGVDELEGLLPPPLLLLLLLLTALLVEAMLVATEVATFEFTMAEA